MMEWSRRLLERLAREAGDVSGRGSLVLAPHPDDEVIGCGGTIARKLRDGEEVVVAFLTDDRRGVLGPDDGVAVREMEARQAAEIMGLPQENIVFLGFEDGALGRHVPEAIKAVSQVLGDREFETIFTPYHRDYHADHRAAWYVAMALRDGGRQVFEYPIWYGPWLWPRLKGRARLAAFSHLREAVRCLKVDIGGAVTVKRTALAAYRSQIASFAEQDPWGTRFLEGFLGRYELFFVTP